jgi:hypothetical protein
VIADRLISILRHRGPKVFGIGLSRTGTTSLNAALELLGLDSIHGPYDPQTRRELMSFLATGGNRLRLSVLRHHHGLTDVPAPVAFEALDAAYSGSRFILTVRDREGWLRSCEAFWRSVIEPYLLDHAGDPFCVYINAFLGSLYGVPGFDPERFSRAHDAYQTRVARYFQGREDDLLVLDVFSGQGWPELCAFLDRPVPDAPFPFENRGVTRSYTWP